MKKYQILFISILVVSCGGSGSESSSSYSFNKIVTGNNNDGYTFRGTSSTELKTAAANYIGEGIVDEDDTLLKSIAIMNLNPFVYVFGNIHDIFDYGVGNGNGVGEINEVDEGVTRGGKILSLTGLRAYDASGANADDLLTLRANAVDDVNNSSIFALAYFNTIKAFLDAKSVSDVTQINGDAEAIAAAEELYSLVQMYKEIRKYKYAPNITLSSTYLARDDDFTLTEVGGVALQNAAQAFIGSESNENDPDSLLDVLHRLKVQERQRIENFTEAFGDISAMFDFAVANGTEAGQINEEGNKKGGEMLASNLRGFSSVGILSNDATGHLLDLRGAAVAEPNDIDKGKAFADAYAHTIRVVYDGTTVTDAASGDGDTSHDNNMDALVAKVTNYHDPSDDIEFDTDLKDAYNAALANVN